MKTLVILSLFVFSTAFADSNEELCALATSKAMSPNIPGVTTHTIGNECHVLIDGVFFKSFEISYARESLEEDKIKVTYTPENIQAEKTCSKMVQKAIQPLEPHAAFVENGACIVTVIGKTFADGTRSPQAGKYFTLEMPQDNL